MFGNKIICPFCFNEIGNKNLNYMCSQSNCLDAGTNKRHIIQKNKPDKNGFCICDVCKRTTSIKVCPHCESVLPDDILERETEIIGIIGAKGAGKSYFVATILRQIMEKGLLSKFDGISAIWALEQSKKEYDKRFKSRMDNFRPIAETQLVTDIVKDNPPLLVELMYSDKSSVFRKNMITKTFSFFDAAGESFEDVGILASVTPYIAHSRAIILILDPRQIRSVDNAISSYIPGLPPVSGMTYSEILNNTIKIIRNEKNLRTKKMIDIPLCVAFSKWDLLMKTPGLLPAGMVISQQNHQYASGYDADLVNTASMEIRSLIMGWEPNLVTMAENNFSTVRYFGFSAWGLGQAEQNGIPPIASYRVEDTFLWILREDKII